MTIGEAIEQLKEADITVGCEIKTKTAEAIEMAIKALKKEQRWTPVSEGLPDTEDEVLCWYEYYHWSKGKVLPEYGIGSYLRETSAWLGEVAHGRDVRVIAWQPLPEPYKAESVEE